MDVDAKKKLSLLDVVQNCVSIVDIEDHVKKNIDKLNQRGWHGLTPLHKAGLRGDSKITELLIKYGADVHVVTDYSETPLHYACKNGNLMNIHLMIEHGADIQQLDQHGRNSLHHAAMGGSVMVLHYLSTVHNMELDVPDKSGQTALHLSSYHGYIDTVDYLLRRERCSPLVKDMNGNTALHMTCINGLQLSAWQILQSGTCSMLHIRNNDGKTPLDIVADKTKSSYQHRMLLKELDYWGKSKLQNKAPKGPLFTWYFLMFFPFLGMLSIILCGQIAGAYRGVFSIIATIVLSVFVSGKIHRLKHISRWPNPIHAGAFAAGILHTIICYLFLILPVLWPHFYALCFNIPSLAVMLYLYLLVLTIDPGLCHSSREGPTLSQPYMTVEDIAKGICDKQDFCSRCEIIRPVNVRHCTLCEKCYYGLDHHCLFLLTCVAKNNHRHFIMLLGLVVLAQSLFIVYGIQYILVLYDPLPETFMLIKTLILEESWFVVLAGLNVASIVWETCLLIYQLRMIANGLTTFYALRLLSKDVRRLTTFQKMQNVRNFLMGRKTISAADLGTAFFKV
ncbi:uncharacterized protein [Antedon mediterranea]|uniref:uncharacterized protein n=1 Tax=Antedon mediterranea TaxID=105859 RepID=UPI003AF473AE